MYFHHSVKLMYVAEILEQFDYLHKSQLLCLFIYGYTVLILNLLRKTLVTVLPAYAFLYEFTEKNKI